MHKKASMAAILLAGTLLTPAHLFAQTSVSPGSSGTETADANLGPADILVTARRREERLQDVPLAITAATGDTLAKMQVTRPDELTRVAPGLVLNPGVYGGSNLNPTIRSQRQFLNNSTYDTSVGIYFAEVPQSRTQGLNAGFFDIANVQVLKGPQGTLFGRNTTGGAILITPVAPTQDFEGYVQGTYGSYNLVDVEGAVNVPLSSTLSARVGGKYTRRDGYIKNLVFGGRDGDLDMYSWRGSLRWAPSDTFTNTLVVNGFHESDDGTVIKITDVRPGGQLATNRNGLALKALLDAFGEFYASVSKPYPDGTRVKTFTVSNITTLELGDVTVKNIFGFRHVNSDILWDQAGDPSVTYELRTIDKGDQYSDELNFSGKSLGGNLNWFAGLFYLREDNHSEQFSRNKYGQTLASTAPGIYADTIADPTNTSKSIYAQGTYSDFLIPGLSLTAGARYTKDKREVEWRSVFIQPTAVCRLVNASGTPLNPCLRTASKSFDAVTWNLSLDYKLSNRVLVYAANRRGYRSGGYTFTAYNPTESLPYRPEKVTDFEIGLKSSYDLGSARLLVNVAAYYQDYKDVQRNLSFSPGTPQNSGTSVATYYVNAAKAKVKGIEVETALTAGRLELGGTFSLSDPKYDSFMIGALDYSGAPFAGAPKYTATYNARYTFVDRPDLGAISAGFNGYYQSRSVSTDAVPVYNPVTKSVVPEDWLESRHIVDASIQWNSVMGTRLDLRAYVKNLFQEKYKTYIQDSYASAFGQRTTTLGEPRTFGIVGKYSF